MGLSLAFRGTIGAVRLFRTCLVIFAKVLKKPCYRSFSAVKNNISGILGLHDTPMIAQVKLSDDRAIAISKAIQDCVDHINFEPIGNLLGFGKIAYKYKKVVSDLIVDFSFSQLGG